MKKYKLEIMGIFGSRRAIYYDTKDQAFAGLLMIKRLGGWCLLQEWSEEDCAWRTVLGG